MNRQAIREGAIGAKVMYCGHDGWFIADIIVVGKVAVVIASGEVDGGSLVRGRNHEATHHLVDFPRAGAWKPLRGFFVVPREQVTHLREAPATAGAPR